MPLRLRLLGVLVCLVQALGCLHQGMALDTSQFDSPPDPAAESTTLAPDLAARVCLVGARAFEKEGYLGDAIDQYHRVLKYQPNNPGIKHRLAVCYERQGDRHRAIEHYLEALKEDPNNPDVLNDFGFCHYQNADYQLAERYLLRATEADPTHARAWVNLGMTNAAQQRYDESYEAFVQVLEPAQAHSNLGALLLQQGKPELAQTHLETAQQLEPSLPPPRLMLEYLEAHPSVPSILHATADSSP